MKVFPPNLFFFVGFIALGAFFSAHYFSLQPKTRVLGDTDHQVIRNITTSQKIVALTFDDGPSPTTQKILAILTQKNIPATFFVVGTSVEKYPEILKQTATAGHEIGNHTNTHPYFWLASQEKVSQEILIADEKIAQVLKTHPTYVRIPYGIYTPNVFATTDILRAPLISWDVDPLDWRTRSSDKIVKAVLKDVKPGSIILLHDGPAEADRSATVGALPQIIDELTKQGYQFTTVSGLLSVENK